MARSKTPATIDLSKPHKLTQILIDQLVCPADKRQAFLRDIKSPSLRVRVMPSGSKSYVFEDKLKRKTIRMTLGDINSRPLNTSLVGPLEDRVELLGAREFATLLKNQVNEGRDPRVLQAEQIAADEAILSKKAAAAVTFGEAWGDYLEVRRAEWSANTYRDHISLSQQGGVLRRRRPGIKTKPGPLASLMGLRLVEVTSSVILTLVKKEVTVRPARVRLALRYLKAFMRWSAEEELYKGNVAAEAAGTKKIRDAAGKPNFKKDHLEKGQLSVWFEHVQRLQNPVISGYLQCLLLTGARREELASLKWLDINFQWKSIELKDKVDANRLIPLTPYVEYLIYHLPRRNEWVFSSVTSKSGRLVEPSISHRQLCHVANLELTLHGLRRSFKSLTEWLEVPVGVVAQLMGHRPSATAEKHYTVRPLDLLRVHHERIESWMLKEAAVKPPSGKENLLSLVSHNT